MIVPNVEHHKMSSIFKIVRTDCFLNDIPVGTKNLYGIDINARIYRIMNLKISSDNDMLLNMWVNEQDTDVVDDYTLVYFKDVNPPYLEDQLNIFGVNRQEEKSMYEDFIFVTIENIGTTPIDKISFSITVEKLARGR